MGVGVGVGIAPLELLDEELLDEELLLEPVSQPPELELELELELEPPSQPQMENTKNAVSNNDKRMYFHFRSCPFISSSSSLCVLI